MLLTPKKPAEIYSFIAHFIFAVIIATSYETAIQVFINPDKALFSDFDSLIPSFELLLAYTAMVSGWVGYSRAMLKWPHTNTKAGALRFALDLAILFCYFGLIASADPQNGFKEHYMNWIITLFILFVVWDIVKSNEYRKKNKTSALSKSFWKTVIFLIVFVLIVPWINNTLLDNQTGIINEEVVYGTILLFVTFLMLVYRYWKWSIPPQKRSVTNNPKL